MNDDAVEGCSNPAERDCRHESALAAVRGGRGHGRAGPQSSKSTACVHLARHYNAPRSRGLSVADHLDGFTVRAVAFRTSDSGPRLKIRLDLSGAPKPLSARAVDEQGVLDRSKFDFVAATDRGTIGAASSS